MIPWTASRQASLSFTLSWSLLKLMSIEAVIPFNHLILCCHLLLLPSSLSESAFHIMWPKYWSFFISPSNEYSGMISFRIDWFDLLAVQGTFKSLLWHHNSKASILQCSAVFMVELSICIFTLRFTMFKRQEAQIWVMQNQSFLYHWSPVLKTSEHRFPVHLHKVFSFSFFSLLEFTRDPLALFPCSFLTTIFLKGLFISFVSWQTQGMCWTRGIPWYKQQIDLKEFIVWK